MTGRKRFVNFTSSIYLSFDLGLCVTFVGLDLVGSCENYYE